MEAVQECSLTRLHHNIFDKFHASPLGLGTDVVGEEHTSRDAKTHFYYLLYCDCNQSSELRSGKYYAQDSAFLCGFGQCPGELTT